MLQSIRKKPIQRNTFDIAAEPIYGDIEEFDNPLSNKLNSKFLETKFRLSINDFKKSPNFHRDFKASCSQS